MGKEIDLDLLLKGLKDALSGQKLLMPVGSKWQVFVPSELAYGERVKGIEAVGPNEDVIMEVELLAIK